MESFNQILQQNLAVVVLSLAVVALAAIVLALANSSRISSIVGRFAWVTGDNAGAPDSLDALLKTVQSNQRSIGVIHATLEKTIEEARTHLRHMGIVRYDAFEGIAGHQSFSLCILDDHRNGVLMTSLVGREFSRSYAVEISEGSPSRKLGDEETTALSRALKAASSDR